MAPTVWGLPLQLQKAELTAQHQRAMLQADYFSREYKRLQDLQQSQSVSLLQLDKARSDFQLAQADADIMAARIAQIDDQLSRTEVRAPFAGIVAERLREAGGDVLRNTALPLGEVALACGFASASHFTNRFKQILGCIP